MWYIDEHMDCVVGAVNVWWLFHMYKSSFPAILSVWVSVLIKLHLKFRAEEQKKFYKKSRRHHEQHYLILAEAFWSNVSNCHLLGSCVCCKLKGVECFEKEIRNSRRWRHDILNYRQGFILGIHLELRPGMKIVVTFHLGRSSEQTAGTEETVGVVLQALKCGSR